MKNRQTLLYIDDNPKSRRLLTAILEQHGFSVIAAGDSLETIGQGDEARFDLVLLDYETSLMSRSELAREIKYKHPDVPIVMISGRALPDEDLIFVDAHFGPGTALDELVSTMCMLIVSSSIAGRKTGGAAKWADST